MSAPNPLKDKLKKARVPVDDINKFLTYVAGERRAEERKEKKPVTNNTEDMLYTLFMKFWRLGLVIDGINVVITGRAMGMVSFHGYKNKVKQTYPSATFDIQLMREGDTFKLRKEDGRVRYSHEIADAFSEKEIKGAYCVIAINGLDYFEGLNRKDFESMKQGSKQKYLWELWDSEFWLKSVIKRACKRHFYDMVAEIDKVDNEDYGQVELSRQAPSVDVETMVNEATTTAELQRIMDSLNPEDKVRAQTLIEERLLEIT